MKIYFALFLRARALSQASSCHTERGFSLPEVLMAMALLSVVILSTMGVLVVGVHRVYGGRKMTEASVLAQNILQRANRPAPYTLFDIADTQSSAVQIWELGQVSGVGYDRTQRNALTPINNAETAGSNFGAANFAVRNEWRDLFLRSNLPYGNGALQESELLVQIDAVPSGSTFATARMARVQVQVRWSENGTRPRQVRVEGLTLPGPEGGTP